jgi:hypothetical protein
LYIIEHEQAKQASNLGLFLACDTRYVVSQPSSW